MSIAVPIIDLSRASNAVGRREVAARIDAALRDVGFMAVTGHGIDMSLVARMFRLVNAFFALPTATKMLAAPPSPEISRGYSFVGAAAQGHANGEETKADLAETFSAGIDPVPDAPYYHAAAAFFPSNIWPDQPAGLAETWLTYLGAMDLLAGRILGLMADALGLPSDWFTPMIDKSMASMTANHYPALDRDPEPGQFRGGAHTDYGTITLLATDSVPGLQLQDEAGQWTGVEPVPGAFHVNTGDMLSLWSGGHWRSTWHRVMPPAGPPPHPARTSLAYFHSPNADAVIAPLPGVGGSDHDFEPVPAGTYLRAKLDRYFASRVAGSTTV